MVGECEVECGGKAFGDAGLDAGEDRLEVASDRHDALGLEGLEAGGVDGFAAGDDVGSDSFTYKLTDSYSRDSNTATVSITVNPLVAASMSAGYDGSCAVLTDSTARCWGGNGSGLLGNIATLCSPGDFRCDSRQNYSKTPVTVVDPADTANALIGISGISAGTSHTCARMTNGTARCWGVGLVGQLGTNATANAPTPVTVSAWG